jgi:hypothetical protein
MDSEYYEYYEQELKRIEENKEFDITRMQIQKGRDKTKWLTIDKDTFLDIKKALIRQAWRRERRARG